MFENCSGTTRLDERSLSPEFCRLKKSVRKPSRPGFEIEAASEGKIMINLHGIPIIKKGFLD